MVYCVAVGCKSNKGKTENGDKVSMHRFPPKGKLNLPVWGISRATCTSDYFPRADRIVRRTALTRSKQGVRVATRDFIGRDRQVSAGRIYDVFLLFLMGGRRIRCVVTFVLCFRITLFLRQVLITF